MKSTVPNGRDRLGVCELARSGESASPGQSTFPRKAAARRHCGRAAGTPKFDDGKASVVNGPKFRSLLVHLRFVDDPSSAGMLAPNVIVS